MRRPTRGARKKGEEKYRNTRIFYFYGGMGRGWLTPRSVNMAVGTAVRGMWSVARWEIGTMFRESGMLTDRSKAN